MVNEETYRKLIEMKFYGLASAFQEYLDADGASDALDFAERFGMMIDREWTERQSRRLKFGTGRPRCYVAGITGQARSRG